MEEGHPATRRSRVSRRAFFWLDGDLSLHCIGEQCLRYGSNEVAESTVHRSEFLSRLV
jgi:hypothetical protein